MYRLAKSALFVCALAFPGLGRVYGQDEAREFVAAHFDLDLFPGRRLELLKTLSEHGKVHYLLNKSKQPPEIMIIQEESNIGRISQLVGENVDAFGVVEICNGNAVSKFEEDRLCRKFHLKRVARLSTGFLVAPVVLAIMPFLLSDHGNTPVTMVLSGLFGTIGALTIFEGWMSDARTRRAHGVRSRSEVDEERYRQELRSDSDRRLEQASLKHIKHQPVYYSSELNPIVTIAANQTTRQAGRPVTYLALSGKLSQTMIERLRADSDHSLYELSAEQFAIYADKIEEYLRPTQEINIADIPVSIAPPLEAQISVEPIDISKHKDRISFRGLMPFGGNLSEADIRQFVASRKVSMIYRGGPTRSRDGKAQDANAPLGLMVHYPEKLTIYLWRQFSEAERAKYLFFIRHFLKINDPVDFQIYGLTAKDVKAQPDHIPTVELIQQQWLDSYPSWAALEHRFLEEIAFLDDNLDAAAASDQPADSNAATSCERQVGLRAE